MLVADVASDSNTGRVLHEGTGHFNPLIIVYTPPGGEPIAGIGYIFSHYEFAEPDWNRLSDAEWADRLQENRPPRPAWASSFLPLAQLEVIYLPLVASRGASHYKQHPSIWPPLRSGLLRVLTAHLAEIRPKREMHPVIAIVNVIVRHLPSRFVSIAKRAEICYNVFSRPPPGAKET